ncbi:MAG: Peptidase and chymotrypsin/Hap [Frankiales bacterium]|nr:Peptidase and chymotrypsin/Hap [Frankiales bacterium]MCW2708484.1 Peptidase and chymotrypsin/Hap [Frankiales bacterium]
MRDMSDHEMPETPWWSQPGTTAVLPTTPPATEPPPPLPPVFEPSAPPRPARRPGTAILLAIALLAGGAAGGGVAELVHNGGTSTLSSSTPLATGTVKNGSSTISGSPESAAAIIGPSVVTIEVTGTQSSGFGQQQVADTGSGVIIRSAGYILTNNHVVAAAANGGTVNVTLADGTTVPAHIVGTDITTDLAVIKIDGQTGLKAATFAASDALKIGQAVIAVGAPLGLSNTVTEGIVSTLHRPVATGDSTSSQAVIDAVQTDAAINPGNSGGALVDLAGRVVAIPSAIASTGSSGSGQSGNIGVGFGIPSETATKVADQLISTGHAVHSQIGVGLASDSSSSTGTPGNGATIANVNAGSPAAKAGLQAGDVVTKVNSRLITDSVSLIAAIRSYDPGTTVTLTYTRGGSPKTTKVTLASATDG